MSEPQIVALIGGLVTLCSLAAVAAGKWAKKKVAKQLPKDIGYVKYDLGGINALKTGKGIEPGSVNGFIGGSGGKSLLSQISDIYIEKGRSWITIADVCHYAKHISKENAKMVFQMSPFFQYDHELGLAGNKTEMWGLKKDPRVQEHMILSHVRQNGEATTTAISLSIGAGTNDVQRACRNSKRIKEGRGDVWSWMNKAESKEYNLHEAAQKIRQTLDEQSANYFGDYKWLCKMSNVTVYDFHLIAERPTVFGLYEDPRTIDECYGKNHFGNLRTNDKVLHIAIEQVLKKTDKRLEVQEICNAICGEGSNWYKWPRFRERVGDILTESNSFKSAKKPNGQIAHSLKSDDDNIVATTKIIEVRENGKVLCTSKETYDSADNLIEKEIKASSESNVAEASNKFLISELTHMESFAESENERKKYKACRSLLEGNAVVTAIQKAGKYNSIEMNMLCKKHAGYETKVVDRNSPHHHSFASVEKYAAVAKTPAVEEKKATTVPSGPIKTGDWVYWKTQKGTQSLRPSVVLDVHNGKVKVCYFCTKGKNKDQLKVCYKPLSVATKTSVPMQFVETHAYQVVEMAKEDPKKYIKSVLGSKIA